MITRLGRLGIIATILILGLLVTITIPATAQNLIAVSPTSVDFGHQPTSTNPTSRKVNLKPQKNYTLRVKSSKWIAGNAGSFVRVTGANPGDPILNAGSPIQFQGIFSTAGLLSGQYEIVVMWADGSDRPAIIEQTVLISVTAKVDCMVSDPACRPKGRECMLDVNNDYHIFFENPTFPSAVKDPLTQVYRRHNSGYNPYLVGVDLIWGIAGLGDLLEELPTCCTECRASCIVGACQANCISNVPFTRVSSSPLIAKFDYSPHSGSLTVKSKPNPLYEIALKVPSSISGQAIVGASYYELHFSNIEKSPHLTIKLLQDSGTYKAGDLLYDSAIQCIGSAATGAFIKNPNSGENAPNAHLYTSDQAIP